MSFSWFKYSVTRFHIFQRGSLCLICTASGWDKCMQNFRKEVTSKFISLNERIILRGIWMNYSMITWAELLRLSIGTVAGYCEHRDWFSISKKSVIIFSTWATVSFWSRTLVHGVIFTSFCCIGCPEQNSLLVPSAVAVSYVVAGSRCSLFDLALRECRTPEFTILHRVGNTLKS